MICLFKTLIALLVDLDLNKINIIKCIYRNKEKYCLQGNQLYYEIGPSKMRGTDNDMEQCCYCKKDFLKI